jgi:hypothetical protein
VPIYGQKNPRLRVLVADYGALIRWSMAETLKGVRPCGIRRVECRNRFSHFKL